MDVGHFVPPSSPEETLKTLGGIGLDCDNNISKATYFHDIINISILVYSIGHNVFLLETNFV